ncbi:MAG: glycosyltransferase [Acidobacteriota bacterium]|nr:glycosyltransferase [Acidobacteriota bacterium]
MNGIPGDVFKSVPHPAIDPRVENARYRVFTISRRDPVKNLGTMLRATEMLAERLPSLVHVVAGPGSEDIEFDGVHLGIGPATEEKVADYLTWSQCFLQVQLATDVGMAAAEALMVGRPVVITGGEGGNARDLISEARGLLVSLAEARDGAVVARTLERCLSRQYDADAIRAFALDRYGEERLREREAQRYQRLAETCFPYGHLQRVALRAALRWRVAEKLVSSRSRVPRLARAQYSE